MIGDLAWFYHWTPREIGDLTILQAMFWHDQALRRYRMIRGHGET